MVVRFNASALSWFIIIVIAVSGTISALGTEANVDSHDKNVMCYFQSWSLERNGAGKFSFEDIRPMLCTHIIYSNVELDVKDFSVKILRKEIDLNTCEGSNLFNKIVQLKGQNFGLKIIIALGGWDQIPTDFNKMASSGDHREQFIGSIIDFLIHYGFDGLSVEWLYPGFSFRPGISFRPEEKTYFTDFLRDLRKAFDKHGFLLLASVTTFSDKLNDAYDIPTIVDYLDYFILRTFEYNGHWQDVTGHNAALFVDPNRTTSNYVERSVREFSLRGVPKRKLLVSISFFGVTFLLKDKNINGVGAPAIKDKGPEGPYTKSSGSWGFNEICEAKTQESNVSKWTEVWDNVTQVPYMFSGEKWISFDNIRSVQLKAEFVFVNQLAGVVVNQINTDDFRGTCFGYAYPLLKSIHEKFQTLSKPTQG